MHYERSLKRATYPPWKDHYIDYQKLKQLLRDAGSDDGTLAGKDDEWTEEDEGAFVEELVNVQLEKVHDFQSKTITSLRDRTSSCEGKLDSVLGPVKSTELQSTSEPEPLAENGKQTLREVSTELDGITKEMNELEKFSRINYTGFLKATKKHDRKRGASYRVRPLMQVRLSALPFNKEDYSPLLFRLSTMYAFIRQNLDSQSGRTMSVSESHSTVGTEQFTSYKFWVHPENLLELKTVILRRLPVLVYNPQTLKVAEGGRRDPTITSIYFDNPQFSLYNAKVDQEPDASSLRLRWYGSLADNPEIYCEHKTVHDEETSEEQKFTTKSKYIQRFLQGEYSMDKDVQRLKDRVGEDSKEVRVLQKTIKDIQQLISENELQPVLRANYTRTAFQIPGDSRVRITIDTELSLIREDTLDSERPCRDPEDWHRRDIDENDMEFPFTKIRKGEINRFPFALLEVRIKGDKKYEWIREIMDSHLVKPTPRFSKFVHGVAQLFDDNVNTFPFWLNDVDTDIRKDPHQAFEEEQERKQQAAADETAVGSLIRSRMSPAFKPSTMSPVGSPRSNSKPSPLHGKANASMTRTSAAEKSHTGREITASASDSDDEPSSPPRPTTSFLPSLSKYARSRRPVDPHARGDVVLPPGVSEPAFWIKNAGPVQVEAKVWLANQRTYIKWQHVGILLSSLSLGLYNAAGIDNNIARTLAVVYTVIGLFTAIWGWGVYMYRGRLIRERSGRDFDFTLGPVVVCLGLIVALCLNFGFKVCFPSLSRALCARLMSVVSCCHRCEETGESADCKYDGRLRTAGGVLINSCKMSGDIVDSLYKFQHYRLDCMCTYAKIGGVIVQETSSLGPSNYGFISTSELSAFFQPYLEKHSTNAHPFCSNNILADTLWCCDNRDSNSGKIRGSFQMRLTQ